MCADMEREGVCVWHIQMGCAYIGKDAVCAHIEREGGWGYVCVCTYREGGWLCVYVCTYREGGCLGTCVCAYIGRVGGCMCICIPTCGMSRTTEGLCVLRSRSW